MIEIKAKPFKDYFKSSEGTRFNSEIPWTVRFRHWFHPLFFFLASIGILLLLSLFNSIYLPIALSLAAYLVFAYFQTKRSVSSLDIQRIAPKFAKHRSRIKIQLKLRNRSLFSLTDIIVKDAFTVSSASTKTLWLGHPIGPRQSLQLNYELDCDTSFGTQVFGPLQIIVSDPLGLYEFRRIDHSKFEIDITPNPSPKLSEIEITSFYSDNLGIHEAPKAGDSVSFYGLRNFSAGDPLKKISWKLSARFQKLVVKEFEDLVSNDFTLFLDFDPEKHFGIWKMNTWDSVKEAAISVLMHKVRNSRFQIISQQLHIPFGAGPHHLSSSIAQICELHPSNSRNGLELHNRLAMLVPYKTSLLHIGPTPVEHTHEFTESLKLLVHKGIHVSAIFIDTATFTKNELAPEIESLVAATHVKAMNAAKDIRARLFAEQIPTTFLEYGDFVS